MKRVRRKGPREWESREGREKKRKYIASQLFGGKK